jgi:soluble lytic murein transglycosylase-like protein
MALSRIAFVCLTAVVLIPAAGAAQADAPPTARDRQLEAAAKQRVASQIQTGATADGSFFSSGWATPAMVQAPTPECPAMDASASDPLIADAASHNKLNPDLVRAVIREESGFRPCVVSEKGAMGLMQLMPDTVQALKTADPFDPAQNIESGARYLRQMLTRFKGDIKLALAAYNAGPEKVDGPTPAIPDIRETRDYVDRIVKALNGAPAEEAK